MKTIIVSERTKLAVSTFTAYIVAAALAVGVFYLSYLASQ